MVSHMSGRSPHNPEHAAHSSVGAARWPVNCATRFDRHPPLPRLATGHRNLSALRVVHEALALWGLAEAVRLFDDRQLVRAAAAARYFELDDLAVLLERAGTAAGTGPAATAFDNEYRRFVTGTALWDAINRTMAERPADFPT